MDVASAMGSINAAKSAFTVISMLGLMGFHYPPDTPLADGTTCDYVLAGGGTAACVLANRLSEDPLTKVCVIEAGGDPTIETTIPGAFPFLPRTSFDWNLVSEDDGYTAQYRSKKYLDLPTGKVLGGSSVVDHLYFLRGASNDYDDWAKATGDDSWSWKNLIPYFKKSEHVDDPFILNSETGKYHGTNGNSGVTRETRELPLKYLKAFEEAGHKIVEDVNGGDSLGFVRPMFSISGGVRQDSASAYLQPIKDRENLFVMKNTVVTKILFDANKRATGVQCTDSAGNVITVNARKEVIVSAGVFNTPKLLMLSGVGPKQHLESLGIPVVSDLPVGQNLQDHMAVVLVQKLEEANETPAPTDSSLFPSPTFVGFGAVNKSQDFPEYKTLNIINRNTPSVLMTLCTGVLALHDSICEQIGAAGVNTELLFVVFNIVRPFSTGSVSLRSADPSDTPKINMGFLSNSADLQRYVDGIQDYNRVTQSTYFRDVGGETMYFDFPSCSGVPYNTTEYWKCYVLNMMDTTFQYSSTCSMGSVLDSSLRVKGVSNLRVVDASAIPNVTSGELYPAVLVLAEKAADLIKRAQACA